MCKQQFPSTDLTMDFLLPLELSTTVVQRPYLSLYPFRCKDISLYCLDLFHPYRCVRWSHLLRSTRLRHQPFLYDKSDYFIFSHFGFIESSLPEFTCRHRWRQKKGGPEVNVQLKKSYVRQTKGCLGDYKRLKFGSTIVNKQNSRDIDYFKLKEDNHSGLDFNRHKRFKVSSTFYGRSLIQYFQVKLVVCRSVPNFDMSMFFTSSNIFTCYQFNTQPKNFLLFTLWRKK